MYASTVQPFYTYKLSDMHPHVDSKLQLHQYRNGRSVRKHVINTMGLDRAATFRTQLDSHMCAYLSSK